MDNWCERAKLAAWKADAHSTWAPSRTLAARRMTREVRGVHSGSAVLKTVRQFALHAVVVDISMPGLNGYDVARGLRAKYGEKVLLIGISGITRRVRTASWRGSSASITSC